MKKLVQVKEYFEKFLCLNCNQFSVVLEMVDLFYKECEYVLVCQYYDFFVQGGGQNVCSLLLGICFVKVFEDCDMVVSYGLQLKCLYLGFFEYQEFQVEK